MNLFPTKDPGTHLHEYLFYKLFEVPGQILWHHFAHRDSLFGPQHVDFDCEACERRLNKGRTIQLKWFERPRWRAEAAFTERLKRTKIVGRIINEAEREVMLRMHEDLEIALVGTVGEDRGRRYLFVWLNEQFKRQQSNLSVMQLVREREHSKPFSP